VNEMKNIANAIVLVIVTAASCFAQTPRLHPNTLEPVKTEAVTANLEGITKQQGDEILKELKDIHQLLERQQAVAAALPQPTAPVSDKVAMVVAPGWNALGRDDAPVTVVEFADYQCPFCRKFHAETFAELKKNYIDTGKVRYISRDLPLEFHPNAPSAALAARCAGEQHKFWEMRELMVQNAANLNPDSILKYGEDAKLDMPKFRGCLDGRKYASAIQKDIADAGTLGIRGTPSFVVGKTAKDTIDGVRIVGAVPYSEFETAIQNQLNTAR
jgi:protein-disulfide isomerase